MVATTSFPLLRKRLLAVAIAGAHSALWAQAPLPPGQEWACQPAGDSWRCQPQPRATSDPDNGGAPAAAATLSARPWDWVPKSELADPQRCDTGCDGAYVAPPADWPDADRNPEQAPMHATADSSRLVGNVATLKGDVAVSQGNRRLRADRATFDRGDRKLQAEGAIEYREPNLLVTAVSAQVDLASSLGEFDDAQFLEHNRGLRGAAGVIARDSADTLRLEQAMVTQCPPGDEVWSIEAGRIELDNASGWGSARHARLNIHDVPVFYAPYMTFPIDDRRKTGLLWPSLGNSSSNGFEITAPLYLNLAPNYDATIAPRYIEQRGTMAQVELRQLSQFGYWTVGGAWLQDDLYEPGIDPVLAEERNIPTREERWAGNIDHRGNIGPIATHVDYSKVSDPDFFRDLTTDSLELKRASHLLQQADLSYRHQQWQTQVLAQQYQTLDNELDDQYRLLPRLAVERLRGGENFALDWQVAAEYTQFDHNDSWDDGGTYTTGQRLFSEAGLSFPMRSAGAFVIPSAKLRSITYDLDATASGSRDSLSATSPLGSLDMGLVFERDGEQYRQTLEPRVYYLYSKYDPQASHPNFDTRELNFSYVQLFRDTRFAGHDRLDDANQVAVGLSNRYIDNGDGLEVLRLSLGQIFYLQDRRVRLDAPLVPDDTPSSLVAAEVQYQPRGDLWFSNRVLWDSRQDRVQEGGVSVHYQTDGDSLYNVSYRFRRDGVETLSGGLRDLSQADASLVLPVSTRWNLYARYRYDTELHRAVDQLAGVRYEDCCWAVSLLFQRGIKDETYDATSGATAVESDNVFVLEFQLKGLGNLGDQARDMLRENILGYEDLEH